jgi:hypothetical protein
MLAAGVSAGAAGVADAAAAVSVAAGAAAVALAAGACDATVGCDAAGACDAAVDAPAPFVAGAGVAGVLEHATASMTVVTAMAHQFLFLIFPPALPNGGAARGRNDVSWA